MALGERIQKERCHIDTATKTRTIAFVGLTIAILAVSAWISVPIGSVPFTLQIFAMAFAILALSPKECMCSVLGYLALGAVGMPVFSGMSGGIGKLLGVTGGFLWGYIFGSALALLILAFLRPRFGNEQPIIAPKKLRQGRRGRGLTGASIVDAIACLAFLAVAYVCGWAQYMVVAHVDPLAAFVVAIAPFIVVDVLKIIAAVIVARAVRAGIR